jgi:hypothetical protein
MSDHAPSEFVWTADVGLFSCPGCEASALAAAIEYDDLGYPICPACGVRRRDLDRGPFEGITLG